MGKKLVSHKNIEEYICRNENRAYIDSSLILTPGARDELLKRGVDIVYAARPAEKGDCPAPPAKSGPVTATDSEERALIEKTVQILNKEYGLTDRDKIMEISVQVIKRLRNNS